MWRQQKGLRILGAGFTLVDLMAIMGGLAFFVVMFLPAMRPARTTNCRLTCANNQKVIALACRQWAIDNNDKFPNQVSTVDGGAKEWVEAGAVYMSFAVISSELNNPTPLICPQEKNPRRVIASSFAASVATDSMWQAIPFTNNNNVSYFVGLDADERQPDTILTGDDNFTVAGVKSTPGVLLLWTNTPTAWTRERHVNQGNFAMADGSVLGLTTPMLGKALARTGMVTNRLAMP